MTRLIFVVPLFWSVAHAQDVAPPPRPSATPAQDLTLPPKLDPAAETPLAPLLESLKQTLLSSGRVEYGWTRDADGRRVRDWQQITSFVADPQGCQAKVHFNNSFDGGAPTDHALSLFFESMDTVEALTEQEAYERMSPSAGRLKALSDGAYTLVINGRVPMFLIGSLMFGSEAQASKASAAAIRAAKICRVTPITLNSASGAPGLSDTLHFIEGKLNDNGTVDYRGTYKNSDDSAVGTPLLISRKVKQAAADPFTCQVRFSLNTAYDAKPSFEEKFVISFRRVERLEVSTEQDAMSRRATPNNASTYSTVPVVYRLSIVSQGNGAVLQFGDEDITHRIAKAMKHAVELCGGGNKEPF
jgi:hypothetical protein